MVLTYIHKLLTHWCVVEYERCLVSTGKQNNLNMEHKQTKGEPSKKRTAANNSNMWRDWGFFTCGEKVMEGDGEARYIGDDTNCENPLKAISDLTDLFTKWTELALTKIFRGNRTSLAQKNSGNGNGRFQFSIYMNEILHMYLSLSKCLIDKGIPIRPSVPSSVIYMCLFSQSVHLISLVCRYITTVKTEILPICKNKAKDLVNDEIAFEQLDVKTLNAVTKDMIAVFANESITLTRGESIFKQHWDIEHEAILKELSLISHPAFLHYTIKFCKESAEDGDDSNFKTIFQRLNDFDSFEFRSFTEYLEAKAPNIAHLYNAHRMLYSSSHAKGSHSTVSNTTSGIGSMKPSKWNSTVSNTTSGVGSLVPRKRPASPKRSTRKRSRLHQESTLK